MLWVSSHRSPAPTLDCIENLQCSCNLSVVAKDFALRSVICRYLEEIISEVSEDQLSFFFFLFFDIRVHEVI